MSFECDENNNGSVVIGLDYNGKESTGSLMSESNQKYKLLSNNTPNANGSANTLRITPNNFTQQSIDHSLKVWTLVIGRH